MQHHRLCGPLSYLTTHHVSHVIRIIYERWVAIARQEATHWSEYLWNCNGRLLRVKSDDVTEVSSDSNSGLSRVLAHPEVGLSSHKGFCYNPSCSAIDGGVEWFSPIDKEVCSGGQCTIRNRKCIERDLVVMSDVEQGVGQRQVLSRNRV